MVENSEIGIPFVPIKPKPRARVVFAGRDPSPRTAKVVGDRGGRSVFINEVFRIADAAGLPEDLLYITDICKCHWRTSRGTPLPGTEHRTSKLDGKVARVCMETWLAKEIKILKPAVLVAFGEELYQLLRPFIVHPLPPPGRLSQDANKSTMDAERWFVENGPMALLLEGHSQLLAPLRHPGNSSGLTARNAKDRRSLFHSRATARVEQLLGVEVRSLTIA
jgi:uracil DNA glycosylase superfamily protein